MIQYVLIRCIVGMFQVPTLIRFVRRRQWLMTRYGMVASD